MPGQPGSENRQRQVVRSTRWTEAEFAQLKEVAAESGCTEAELLRRLVKRANKNILITRELVTQVTRLGTNVNQIARRLNAGGAIAPADLQDAYRALLDAVTISRS
jgi:hypothetical protein